MRHSQVNLCISQLLREKHDLVLVGLEERTGSVRQIPERKEVFKLVSSSL